LLTPWLIALAPPIHGAQAATAMAGPASAPSHKWTGAPPPVASHAAHTPSNDVTAQARKPSMDGMHMEH